MTPGGSDLEYLLNFKANECILAQKQFTTDARKVVFNASSTSYSETISALAELQLNYKRSTKYSKCILMAILKHQYGEHDDNFAIIDLQRDDPMYQIALIHAYSYSSYFAEKYVGKLVKADRPPKILSYILIPDLIKVEYQKATDCFTSGVSVKWPNINKNFKSGMMMSRRFEVEGAEPKKIYPRMPVPRMPVRLVEAELSSSDDSDDDSVDESSGGGGGIHRGGGDQISTLRNIPMGVLAKLETESLEKMLRLVNAKLSDRLINDTSSNVRDIVRDNATIKLHWFRDVAVRDVVVSEGTDELAEGSAKEDSGQSYLANLNGARIQNMPARCDANSVFSLRKDAVRQNSTDKYLWVSDKEVKNELPKIEFKHGVSFVIDDDIYNDPIYKVWAKLFTITGTDSTLSSIRTDNVNAFIEFFDLNTLIHNNEERDKIKELLTAANVLRHPIFPYSAVEPVWYSNTRCSAWASPPSAASGNLWISSGKKIKRANIKTHKKPLFNDVMSSLHSFYYSIEDRWHDFHGSRGLFNTLLSWFNGGYESGMQVQGGNYIFPVDVENMEHIVREKSQFFTAKRGTSGEHMEEYNWGSRSTIQSTNIQYETFIPFNINCRYKQTAGWECILTFNWKQWTSTEGIWRSSSVGTRESYFSINSLSNVCFHWILSLDNEWDDINNAAQGETYFIKGLVNIREAVGEWAAARQEPDPPALISNQLSQLYDTVKADLGAAEAFKWVLYVIFSLKKMGDASSSTFAYIYNCVVGALKVVRPQGLNILLQDASEFQLINYILLEQGDRLAAAYGLGCGFQVYGIASKSLYGIVRNIAFINPNEKTAIRRGFINDNGYEVDWEPLAESVQFELASTTRDVARLEDRVGQLDITNLPDSIDILISVFPEDTWTSDRSPLVQHYLLWKSSINELDNLLTAPAHADTYMNILDIMTTIDTLKSSIGDKQQNMQNMQNMPDNPPAILSKLLARLTTQHGKLKEYHDKIIDFKTTLTNRKYTFSQHLRIPEEYHNRHTTWRVCPYVWAIDPDTCSPGNPKVSTKANMRNELYSDLCGKSAPERGEIDQTLKDALDVLDLYLLKTPKRSHGGINKTLLTKGRASYNELTQHMPNLNVHDTNPNDDRIPDSRWERYRYYGETNIARWSNREDMGTLFKLMWLSEPNFSYKPTFMYPKSWYATFAEHTRRIVDGEMPDTPTDGKGTDFLLTQTPIVSYMDAIRAEVDARALIPAVKFRKTEKLPGIKIFLMLNPQNIPPEVSGTYRSKHESRLLTRPQYARLDMLFAYAVMDYSTPESNNITSLNKIYTGVNPVNSLFGFLDTAYRQAGVEMYLGGRRALLPDWADLAPVQAAKFSEHGVDGNMIIDIDDWDGEKIDRNFAVNISEHDIEDPTYKAQIKTDLTALKELLVKGEIGHLKKTDENRKYHDENWGYRGLPVLNKFKKGADSETPSNLYIHFYAPLRNANVERPSDREILRKCAEREGIIVDFFNHVQVPSE